MVMKPGLVMVEAGWVHEASVRVVFEVRVELGCGYEASIRIKVVV